jgi:hypothetical protein
MILPNEPSGENPALVIKPAPARQPRAVEPLEFFQAVDVGVPGLVQCIVTNKPDGNPGYHAWQKPGEDFAAFAVKRSNKSRRAYFSVGAYPPDRVSAWEGRKAENDPRLKTFHLDVDVRNCIDKDGNPYTHGDENSAYTDAQAARTAAHGFIKETCLRPSLIVETGSGGFQIYFVLDAPITKEEWLPRARALAALCVKHGLIVDTPVTCDAARILRAPGSFHNKTGKLVTAMRGRVEPYTLAEWDRLTGYVPGALPADVGLGKAGALEVNINGDILDGTHTPYSYKQAAQRCGAMREAAERNGRDTPYQAWILAAKTADLSIEGRSFAHDISSGHEGYDEATTDKKIDSLTGGPANCEAWTTAYGAGGPCESCEFRGKIKNPAVQLGALVDTTPPGSFAIAEPESVVDWVAELNTRFALVRHGTKLVIVDFQTPSMSGRGVSYGIGFLDVAGFRSMLNGRFAPVQKAGDKQRGLADAWLAHPQRRQYEGLVYAPGESLSASMLNLWQGFAVEPVAGDVSLWLEVLAALVPDPSERRYVLRWLAWKIQNPGGVPDTILIFKGAKGTGKNSLFDPFMPLFGRHAMLADDPELIAGRFTWHLMTLSFAVLDEAVFIQDPRQADRIKSRVTAKTMMYEQKGMDPVSGVNRCAYVMLTNHEYVWQATTDERRAVVIEAGESLRGNLEFWKRYHAWAMGDGPAALLHYLQGVDLTGFNPREIPKGEALRKQVEQTALRNPAAGWWHQCLTEGEIRWRDGSIERVVQLDETADTEINRAALRLSYEQSAGARGRASTDWAAVARRLNSWAGPAGIRKTRVRTGPLREWRDVLPPLPTLRASFTAATQVEVAE